MAFQGCTNLASLRFLGDAPHTLSPDEVEAAMVDYMAREAVDNGTPWPAIARHMLGLHHGRRGARLWRQVWSDHKRKPLPAADATHVASNASE